MSACLLCRDPLCLPREELEQHYYFVLIESATGVPFGTAMHFSTACEDRRIMHTFYIMDQLMCIHDLSRDTYARVGTVDGDR
jgi:hypothetical protein